MPSVDDNNYYPKPLTMQSAVRNIYAQRNEAGYPVYPSWGGQRVPSNVVSPASAYSGEGGATLAQRGYSVPGAAPVMQWQEPTENLREMQGLKNKQITAENAVSANAERQKQSLPGGSQDPTLIRLANEIGGVSGNGLTMMKNINENYPGNFIAKGKSASGVPMYVGYGTGGVAGGANMAGGMQMPVAYTSLMGQIQKTQGDIARLQSSGSLAGMFMAKAKMNTLNQLYAHAAQFGQLGIAGGHLGVAQRQMTLAEQAANPDIARKYAENTAFTGPEASNVVRRSVAAIGGRPDFSVLQNMYNSMLVPNSAVGPGGMALSFPGMGQPNINQLPAPNYMFPAGPQVPWDPNFGRLSP